MTELAIFIKTFNREEALLNCIESIKKYLTDIDYRIYIADDGEKTETKTNLYKNLKRQGHVIKELDYNIGASKSRNILLKSLQDEKYILRLDDDFEFYEETNIEAMINILESVFEIDVVADLEKQVGNGKSVFSGEISPWQGFFLKRKNKLIKKVINIDDFFYFKTNKYKFAYCDFTRNFLLIRREVFNNIKWDDKIPFAKEHEDFMLELKKYGYNIVFTPDSIHLHRDDIESTKTYKTNKYSKKNKKNSEIFFYKKWNINKISLKRPIIYCFKAMLIKTLRLIKKGGVK